MTEKKEQICIVPGCGNHLDKCTCIHCKCDEVDKVTRPGYDMYLNDEPDPCQLFCKDCSYGDIQKLAKKEPISIEEEDFEFFYCDCSNCECYTEKVKDKCSDYLSKRNYLKLLLNCDQPGK